jgi:hypothetical protein
VSFWRSIRTTAWGRFSCKLCGSILGIDVKRRLLAIIPLLACAAFLLFAARLQRFGIYGLLAGYFASFFFIFYLFEDIILIERRAFCCRKCGYELEGLTVPRCPECGTGFDPAERRRILERIGKPIPRARYRWVLVLLVLLLLGTLIANILTYRRAKGTRRQTPVPQQLRR